MIPKLETILLVTDFSRTAEYALPYAYSIIEPGGTVHLVHIIEHRNAPHPLYSHYTPDDLHNPQHQKEAIAKVEAHLRDTIPQAATEKKVETVIHGVMHPQVAPGILSEARDRGADAIVIGSHGRSGLAHIILGSIAEEVIQHSEIPVFVVPRRG